ncbi:MAG: hypothetical protein IT381_21340 [Deltaproteobacteria bacterium]|nr:hypothetical protein [Deltaproteobacteria bacterium]
MHALRHGALAYGALAYGALACAALFAGCLARVDPHTFENFASRVEIVADVSSLGSGTSGTESRVIGEGDIIAVFSREYESFLQKEASSGSFSVLFLRTTSRDVSRCTPFILNGNAYFMTRKPGTELAAGFAISGANVGSVVATVRAPTSVTPTGVGYGDERGFVFILRSPAELWAVKPDGVTVEAKIPISDPDSYLAMSRLPNGVVMAVKLNALTTADLATQQLTTISLERQTELPVTNITPFGAVLPYADNAAFVVEGGKTIYTVRADSFDAAEVTTRQEKALNARSIVFDGARRHLVVANGIGGIILFDAKNPEALVYLNRASSTNIGGQISYNASDDSFAAATTPVSAVYKIFTP